MEAENCWVEEDCEEAKKTEHVTLTLSHGRGCGGRREWSRREKGDGLSLKTGTSNGRLMNEGCSEVICTSVLQTKLLGRVIK